MKFWYHMYGASIGTLNVLVKTGAGNRSDDLVWTLSGNQQNQWKFGQAPAKSLNSAYQVTRVQEGNAHELTSSPSYVTCCIRQCLCVTSVVGVSLAGSQQ